MNPNAFMSGGVSSVAHPAYAAEQVLLWLPGLPGGESAFCSRNRQTGDPEWKDPDGVFAGCPFPVNPRTCVAWDRESARPFPYHAIPLARPLDENGMLALATGVLLLMAEKPESHVNLLQVLKHWNLPYIRTVVEEMRLLPVPA